MFLSSFLSPNFTEINIVKNLLISVSCKKKPRYFRLGGKNISPLKCYIVSSGDISKKEIGQLLLDN